MPLLQFLFNIAHIVSIALNSLHFWYYSFLVVTLQQIPSNIFENLQILRNSQLGVDCICGSQQRLWARAPRSERDTSSAMYRQRRALLLEWPISATKPEFEKGVLHHYIHLPRKNKQIRNKPQAALCACTQLHATCKISYNCRIIERGKAQENNHTS